MYKRQSVIEFISASVRVEYVTEPIGSVTVSASVVILCFSAYSTAELIGRRAVSYTHLDVYKRQIKMCVKINNCNSK